MIAAITTAVAVFIYVAFGRHQAENDKGGKPVNQHAPDWQNRAEFAGIVAFVLSLMRAAWGPLIHGDHFSFVLWGWCFAGLCLLAYGVFTPVFRWRLNYWREMSPWYISPSSWYDWQFMLLERNHFVGDRKKDQADHDELYHANLFYKADIHRAGMIAYACELTAAAIGCWIINA